MRICLAALTLSLLMLAGCVPSEEPAPAAGVPSETPVAAPTVPESPPGSPVATPPSPPAMPAAEDVIAKSTPVAAATAPEAEAPSEAPSKAPSPDASAAGEQKVSSLTLDGAPGMDLRVKTTPVAGKNLFTVEGAFDIDGTISLPDAEAKEWVFDGSMTFPNDGYKVGDVVVSGTKAQMPPTEEGGEGEIVTVMVIVIPMEIPGPDAEVKEGDVKVPIKMNIPAPSDVRFVVMLKAA